MAPTLCLAQDSKADKLISEDPFALLVGMVLDQQIPLEKAFAGPLELKKRLGGKLDAKQIANYDTDELVTLFCNKPALHRFPAANAQRVQAMAVIITEQYGGDAARIWSEATTGADMVKRIEELPGFGKIKARIFVGLLGKQFGVKPRGWQAACDPFGKKGTTMSIADIVDNVTLQKTRVWKQKRKAAAKAAAAEEG